MKKTGETGRTRLSVSMIVRNEELLLRGCLESIQSVADEIVIVDTGSMDRTVQIAGEFGAKVFLSSWEGDFSAARNMSLQHCSGDWVLYIDADERLTKPGADEVLRLIGKADAAAYYCLLQSEERLPDGTVYSVAAYPRLFRNMPKFRFTGRVHEQIEPSIVRSGLRLKHSNVVIEHLGYAQSAEINRAKCERNMALLRDQVLENPGDQYSRYQLGNTLAILGFNQEAMEELGKVLRDGSVGTTLRVSVLNCLAHVAENLGGVEEGLTFSRESLDLDKGQISARWQIAGFCMIRREYADALELLKEIESLQHSRHRGEKFNRPLDAVIPEVALVQRIATCLGAEGKFSEASDWLFRVLEKHVDDERVLSRYFLCLAQLDDLAGHADQLEQLMSRGVRSSSLYCALARLYLCRGESQRAKATLERCPRTEQANAELSALWLEYALANADMMRARKAYETALRLGVDTYRFHKTAVKYLLASRDLSRAVLHLQKMGQGMEQMQPSHSASSPL